jgi:hypothetical protein
MPLFIVGPRIKSLDTALFLVLVVSLVVVVDLVNVFCVRFSFLVDLWRSCPDSRVADFLQVPWLFAIPAGVVGVGVVVVSLGVVVASAGTPAIVVVAAAASPTSGRSSFILKPRFKRGRECFYLRIKIVVCVVSGDN